jgi:DNA-binding IclR family transcriptional regulator
MTRYAVPGLERGLNILLLFSRTRRTIGAPEIARELGIPRSTVFRLIQTLEDMGFLQQVENGHDYALGAGVLTLGFEYLGSLDLVELANPVLAQLRDRTGCSAHLAIRRDTDVIYLSRHASRSAISSSVNVGTSLPAHATVMGRMMLADLSDAELGALYAGRSLARFTDQTPTTLAVLRALLAEDRRRGYAISKAYFERGVTAVAAPVRDHAGRASAAINVTTVDNSVDPRRLEGEIKDAVCEAARAISALLGAPPISAGSVGADRPAAARRLVAQRA